MVSIGVVILISFIHWFSDFHMQTHEMATNKSSSNYWLSMHVLVYTGVTFLFWNFFIFQPSFHYNLLTYTLFVSYIFLTHWVTDYITSRMSSKLFAKGLYHDFFVVIGADQLLHLIQLLLAYKLFIN